MWVFASAMMPVSEETEIIITVINLMYVAQSNTNGTITVPYIVVLNT